MEISDLKNKKIHIIGVSGIGMSAIAKILYKKGYDVSGSCDVLNKHVVMMQEMGIDIVVGHHKSNVVGKDVILHSTVIGENHIEILEAKKNKKIILNRQLFFSFFFKDQRNIAVTGTHGKTSTTAMIANVFLKSRQNFNLLLGAYWDLINSNVIVDDSDDFIIEADESDGSFLGINTFISIVNNVDEDHMDYYGNMERLVNAYKEFIHKTRDDGAIFVNGDDEILWGIKQSSHRKIYSYGFNDNNDVFVYDYCLRGGHQYFKVRYFQYDLGEFELSILGKYNVLNSLSAIVVGRYLDFPLENIKKGILSYKLPKRRMEIKGKYLNMNIFDDYAHHPVAMKKTYEALKSYYTRVIVIFQPHRYTRLRNTYSETISVLKMMDKVFILPVYSAGEKPIKNYDSESLSKKVEHSKYVKNFSSVKESLNGLESVYDVIVLMGAGNVVELSDFLLGVKNGKNS